MQVVPVLTIPPNHLTMKEGVLEQSADLLAEKSFESLLQTSQQGTEDEAELAEGNLDEGNVFILPLQEGQDVLFNITLEEQQSDVEVEDVTDKSVTKVDLLVDDELKTNDELKTIDGLKANDEVKANNEVALKNTILQEELIPIIDTIKSLLTGSKDSEDLKEVASHLLPILQKWTSVKQQVSKDELEPVLEKQLTKEQWNILKLLESNLDKRNHYTNQYRQDASVTRTDMMNWLQVALDRYTDVGQEQQGRVLTPTMTHQQAVPISEVQQHTIHIQSLDRVDRVSEELTQKLATIIKESRFLTKPNNLQQMNQLTVVLRPEHLGNITVRFQQVDGNMTVNMIVSSQATKELLESNIHQLKHMFSPHQIFIERDGTISDEEFFKEKQEKEEKEKQDEFDESKEPETGNDNDSEFDFQSFIEQFSKEVNA